MTEPEKNALREISAMKPFMFYLDDVTKLEVMKKLREQGCDTKKGSLSALIRVLLSEFAAMADGSEQLDKLIAKVQEEYIFTTKRNKRSTM